MSAFLNLVLSKFAANREKDEVFNRAVIGYQLVDQAILLQRLPTMPLDKVRQQLIATKIKPLFQTHSS